MSAAREQALAESDRRYPESAPMHPQMRWMLNDKRKAFQDGYFAGHEAATRTREVTTAVELDALPVGSVVLSVGGGAAWQRVPGDAGFGVGIWTGVIATSDAITLAERGYLPARVLHTPEVAP